VSVLAWACGWSVGGLYWIGQLGVVLCVVGPLGVCSLLGSAEGVLAAVYG
jgi:hypothetical protein